MPDTFRAYMLEEVDGKPKGGFRNLTVSDLPANPVLVDVAYSSLNYKDGLAVTGKGKIARKLSMVCGVDLAGTQRAADLGRDRHVPAQRRAPQLVVEGPGGAGAQEAPDGRDAGS